MLVRVIFSLIAAMCVILVGFGKKLIKHQREEIHEIPFNEKIIQGSLFFFTILACMIIKEQIEVTFLFKAISLVVALAIYVVMVVLQQSHRIFLLVALLTTILFIINWST